MEPLITGFTLKPFVFICDRGQAFATGKRVSSSDESIFMLKAVIDNDKLKNARRELQKNSRSFCCLLVWVGNVF